MIRLEKLAHFLIKNGQGLLFPQDATDVHIADLYSMPVQGQCNGMFAFQIKYRSENHVLAKEFVLRTCRTHSEDRMAKEFKAMKALKAKGITVPTAILLELNPKTIGSCFMILEKINGVSVSNLINTEEKALSSIQALARILVTLHKVDANILFPIEASESELVQASRFRASVLSELRNKIDRGYLTSFSFFARRKYLAAASKLEKVEIQPSRMSLIHADFGPDHVLWTDDGPIVTDWEGIRLGDPAYDLGWLYQVIELEGRIMVDHRFVKPSKSQSYSVDFRQELLKSYRKFGGALPKNLEFYEDLAALRLAVTLDLNVRPGYASFSRSIRLKPREIFSQTVIAYNAIKAYQRTCDSFLRERNFL